MKLKETSVFIVLLVIGLLFGSLIGDIFANWVPILAKSQQITWHPQADFNILKYDFLVKVKLNLASVIGLAMAFWVYRKI